MTRDEAIGRLSEQAEAVKALGATSLFLYGSLSRDAATAASDLDIFIDDDTDSRFNAFDLVGIKLLLEERLNVPVDVTTRDGLHPMLRDSIERAAIRIF